MRAYAVYLTHAFVIKRDLIPEWGAKLRQVSESFGDVLQILQDCFEWFLL